MNLAQLTECQNIAQKFRLIQLKKLKKLNLMRKKYPKSILSLFQTLIYLKQLKQKNNTHAWYLYDFFFQRKKL